MGYHYKWKPSKTAKREFAKKMSEIDEFCKREGISQSRSSDSYYFTINDQEYRISNHAVEKSVGHDIFGNEFMYHGDSAEYRKDVICIHASKTRIIEIYEDLKDGWILDGHGNRVRKEVKNEELQNA